MGKIVWKPCGEHYEVSNMGTVRNSKRGNILSQSVGNGQGKYRKVSLGRGRIKLVHRLVATAFIPNPNNLPEVNHKDKDTVNNSVDNLEWVNRKENNIHMGGMPIQVTKNGVCVWFPCIGDFAKFTQTNHGNTSRFARGIKYKQIKGWRLHG